MSSIISISVMLIKVILNLKSTFSNYFEKICATEEHYLGLDHNFIEVEGGGWVIFLGHLQIMHEFFGGK